MMTYITIKKKKYFGDNLNMSNKENYYLMHKNITVCLLSISPDGEMTLGAKSVDNIKHFPVGGKLNDSKFADWWKS